MTIDKGIFIKNVFYMLSYAFQELKHNNYENIAGEKFEYIHDLFAEILIHGVSFQLKKGIHKGYVCNHDLLNTLRGKLDLHSTITQKIRCDSKLVCEYDEFSSNNIFNQIIKTTLTILIKQPDVKIKRKRQLSQLLLFFQDVDLIDFKKIKWNTFRFDRNTRTYQMLLYICHFIIDEMILTTEKGPYNMVTYMDEQMNRLFEKFVLEYYKKEFPQITPEAKYIDWNVDKTLSTNDFLPIMKTDIILHFETGRDLIIDTKYYGQSMQYHYNKPTIHSHNLYQIHTYIINKDIGHKGEVDGMLLYAKTEEDIVPNGQIQLIDGNIIYFRTLDLAQDFKHIKEQLNNIVLLYLYNS